MDLAAEFEPLRNLRDIEALERAPLEQRLLSMGCQRLIRRGLDLAPDKVVIRYVADGNPDSPPISMTYWRIETARDSDSQSVSFTCVRYR